MQSCDAQGEGEGGGLLQHQSRNSEAVAERLMGDQSDRAWATGLWSLAIGKGGAASETESGDAHHPDQLQAAERPLSTPAQSKRGTGRQEQKVYECVRT